MNETSQQTTTLPSLANLVEQLGPGYHLLNDNFALESEWLAIQKRSNEAFGPRTDEIQELGSKIIDVVERFGGYTPIMDARLDRIAVLNSDQSGRALRTMGLSTDVTSLFTGNTGRILVPQVYETVFARHALAHEITHGLAASGWLIVSNDKKALLAGNGVKQIIANDGEILPEDLEQQLTVINEVAAETVACMAGNSIDKHIKEGIGYSDFVAGMQKVQSHEPDTFQDIMHRMFVTGIETVEQGYDLVQKFNSAVPEIDLNQAVQA